MTLGICDQFHLDTGASAWPANWPLGPGQGSGLTALLLDFGLRRWR
jgi:hypothetical protein